MKKFLFLAAFVTAAVLQSATFFPNGDLSITKGYTPDVRTFKGKAKFQRLKNALLLETFSQDASIEINFHKLPAPEAGKTIYVRVPFEILEDFRSGMDGVLGEGACHVLSIRPQGGVEMEVQ